MKGAAYSGFARGCKPGGPVRTPARERGEATMILPITLTLAGAATLLHIWLAARVSRVRRQFKIGLGDGGNEGLLRRVRAHGNYIENMPLVPDPDRPARARRRRPAHPVGGGHRLHPRPHRPRLRHGQPGAARLRMIGMIVSTLVLIGLAGWALSFAYRQPPPEPPHEIMIGPGRTALGSAPAPGRRRTGWCGAPGRRCSSGRGRGRRRCRRRAATAASVIASIRSWWLPIGKSVRPIEPWNSTSPTIASREAGWWKTTWPGVWPGQ